MPLIDAATDTEEWVAGSYDVVPAVYPDDAEYDPPIGGGTQSRYSVCPSCGWISIDVEMAYAGLMGYRRIVNALCGFEISSSALSLEELGTHLRRRYEDVYSLSWERFEDLVADIFRRTQDRRVIQTIRRKDNGADLVLLSSDGTRIDAIVECKRYSQDRRVDVALVRQLVGASVAWKTRSATLVTSSAFTSDAEKLAHGYRADGYDVDLIGASELLSLLSCYNAELPPLHVIDEPTYKNLIRENSDEISNCVVLPTSRSEEEDAPAFMYRRVITRR